MASREQLLVTTFVDLADTLVADFDVIDFLHGLTEHAAAVSGADAVGLVLADHRGALRYMAASNPSGKSLELFQLDPNPRAPKLFLNERTHSEPGHAYCRDRERERQVSPVLRSHPVGAPHMINPEKLLASATRIYGDRMDSLWGEFLPVPKEKLIVANDMEEINLGNLSFVPINTPGHAEHHYAYVFEDICFSGDVGGVRNGRIQFFA